MIVHVDFTGRRPAITALDHATREAARVYADQTLEGWRQGFPLVVRDAPADALYQRTPAILLEQIDHVAVDKLERAEQEEIAARSYHEKFVTLAGAMAFQRRTGQSADAMAADLAGHRAKPSPLADSEAIQHRLCSWTSDSENEVWMAIHMSRVDRFLDRNWGQICQLAEVATKARLDADGYRVMSVQEVEAVLRRRPLKLSKDDRERMEKRRTSSTLAAGRDVARRLKLSVL